MSDPSIVLSFHHIISSLPLALPSFSAGRATHLQNIIILRPHGDRNLLDDRQELGQVLVGQVVQLGAVVCSAPSRPRQLSPNKEAGGENGWRTLGDDQCVTFGKGANVEEGEPG